MIRLIGGYFFAFVAAASAASYIHAFHMMSNFDGLKFRTPGSVFEFQMAIWIPVGLLTSLVFGTSLAVSRKPDSCRGGLVYALLAGAATPGLACALLAVQQDGYELLALLLVPILGGACAARWSSGAKERGSHRITAGRSARPTSASMPEKTSSPPRFGFRQTGPLLVRRCE